MFVLSLYCILAEASVLCMFAWPSTATGLGRLDYKINFVIVIIHFCYNFVFSSLCFLFFSWHCVESSPWRWSLLPNKNLYIYIYIYIYLYIFIYITLCSIHQNSNQPPNDCVFPKQDLSQGRCYWADLEEVLTFSVCQTDLMTSQILTYLPTRPEKQTVTSVRWKLINLYQIWPTLSFTVLLATYHTREHRSVKTCNLM